MQFVETHPHVAAEPDQYLDQHEHPDDDDDVDPGHPPAALDLLSGYLRVGARDHRLVSSNAAVAGVAGFPVNGPNLHVRVLGSYSPAQSREGAGGAFNRGEDNGHASAGGARTDVRVVHESLVADGAGVHRNDVDLQSAIHLDAVHSRAARQARCFARAIAGDFLAADRPADLLLTDPGMAGRSLRAEAADLGRLRAFGTELGTLVLRRQHLGAVLHLRHHRWLRYGHRLRRDHRAHGALVSRPPRFCCGCRRGRLRRRRDSYLVPDRPHDSCVGLCAHAVRMGLDPARRRRRGQPGFPHSRGRVEACRAG